MSFSFLRVLLALKDEHEDLIRLLTAAIDQKAPLLDPFDGLMDQYWAGRIENGFAHRDAFNEDAVLVCRR